MYFNLPNMGLNFSLPIYLFIALVLFIAGLIMTAVAKIRG